MLIVNDGSTDSSPDIINEYAEKEDRIKVFHKKNSGVSSARNIALSYVRGELVTFIDSDDVYHPNRLEKMVNVFEMYPTCDFVFSKYREFKGKLEQDNEISYTEVVLSDDNVLKRIISDLRYHFVWNGCKPVFTTMSTFFQRTYDQILHDLCINCAPVTLIVVNASVYASKT